MASVEDYRKLRDYEKDKFLEMVKQVCMFIALCAHTSTTSLASSSHHNVLDRFLFCLFGSYSEPTTSHNVTFLWWENYRVYVCLVLKLLLFLVASISSLDYSTFIYHSLGNFRC